MSSKHNRIKKNDNFSYDSSNEKNDEKKNG